MLSFRPRGNKTTSTKMFFNFKTSLKPRKMLWASSSQLSWEFIVGYPTWKSCTPRIAYTTETSTTITKALSTARIEEASAEMSVRRDRSLLNSRNIRKVRSILRKIGIRLSKWEKQVIEYGMKMEGVYLRMDIPGRLRNIKVVRETVDNQQKNYIKVQHNAPAFWTASLQRYKQKSKSTKKGQLNSESGSYSWGLDQR